MLLSIRLTFCQFQPGVACKIVAYKESVYVSFSIFVISFQSKGEMLRVIHVCSFGYGVIEILYFSSTFPYT